MGQYFTLVNLYKKEYVTPWDINGGVKLWKWMTNLDESQHRIQIVEKQPEKGKNINSLVFGEVFDFYKG